MPHLFPGRSGKGARAITDIKNACPDCGSKVGVLHKSGCDVERCPRCGGQMISCDCIYEVCGMNVATLDEDYPQIYNDGPTKQMIAKWDAAWDAKRMPWTGEWPGVAAARGFGWFTKMIPGKGWIDCPADDPEARPNLNKLYTHARWNPDSQQWIKE